MQKPPKGIFVTGTDTGVGKTVVSTALYCCLRSAGIRASVIKPVQTGTDLPGMTDTEFAVRTTGEGSDKLCIYSFPQPLSPLAASVLSDKHIDKGYIIQTCLDFSEKFDVVIIEGAGGIRVPIKYDYYMHDLARDLGLETVIVSRPGLGTINHTLLTVDFLKSADLDIAGIVFSGFPESPDLAEETNPLLIERLSKAEIAGVVPYIDGLSVEEGRPSDLYLRSPGFFIPRFGGNFDKQEFYSKLKNAGKF